jgi:hypothetical protein
MIFSKGNGAHQDSAGPLFGNKIILGMAALPADRSLI